MKLWVESLVLMSVDYASALPEANSTTVRDLYRLWAACPWLSWSAVAMHVFNLSHLRTGLPSRWCCTHIQYIHQRGVSEGSVVSTCTGTWILTSFSTCTNLKSMCTFVCMFVQFKIFGIWSVVWHAVCNKTQNCIWWPHKLTRSPCKVVIYVIIM